MMQSDAGIGHLLARVKELLDSHLDGSQSAADPYELRASQAWARDVASFEQERLDDGATVVLHGQCPTCGHEMEVELPVERATNGLRVGAALDAQALRYTRRVLLWRKSERPAAFVKTAHCNCRMGHSGRPEAVTEGCGAFGNLRVG